MTNDVGDTTLHQWQSLAFYEFFENQKELEIKLESN
jgi:hypothetical protein